MILHPPIAAAAVDVDAPATHIERAWRAQARIDRLKAALQRAETERDEALQLAREAGETEADIGYGVLRFITKLPVMTRVLDVEAFREHYPKEFRKAAKYSCTLKDAERVLGTDRLGELVTYRVGAERYELKLEPKAGGPVREVAEP